MSTSWILPIFLIFIMALPLHGQSNDMTFETYIREGVPARQEIDVFLREPSWAAFDSELGYILGNYAPQDGLAGSSTLSTTNSVGARTSFAYAEQPCRINTYGNSFTQCHQVSDAETWQEYLAGHLGEPIRNFGMGGYGVYQAYRRMLREETGNHQAKHIIFYIWGGDHIRSMFRCRYMAFQEWTAENNALEGEGRMFHGNFWPNVEMDLKSGELREHESRVQSAEALYQMTDPDWMVDNLKTDLALQMFLFVQNKIDYIDIPQLRQLSQILQIDLSWEKNHLRASVSTLLDKYSFAVTKFILDKVRAFADENGKKLLVVLFDPYRVLRPLLAGQPRYEQDIVDYLQENQCHYFDMNLVHVKDFKDFNLSVESYFDRYFIGHYNPHGNHFFAYQIRPEVIKMLTPKPFTYSQKQRQAIQFKNYLNKY